MLRHASGCLRSTSPLSSRDIPGMNGEVSLENRLIDTKYHRKLDFHARWCACGAWLTAGAPRRSHGKGGLYCPFPFPFPCPSPSPDVWVGGIPSPDGDAITVGVVTVCSCTAGKLLALTATTVMRWRSLGRVLPLPCVKRMAMVFGSTPGWFARNARASLSVLPAKLALI